MPTKDQERALRAYENVQPLWAAYLEARSAGNKTGERNAKKVCDDYEIAVKALGANILRSGLSAGLADLMRRGDRARRLREHLAASRIPGLAGVSERDLFIRVNGLETGPYMLATRETLQVVMWLKRACEALFDFKPDSSAESAAGSDGDVHAQ
jgi:CRISPR-associated protein Cmr5